MKSSIIAIALSVGLVVVVPDAGACTSRSTCRSKVLCGNSSWDLKRSGTTFYCVKKYPAATKAPTCSRYNNANDWKWSSNGYCYRYKGKQKVRSFNRPPITCADGYKYEVWQKICKRSEHYLYARPYLTSVTTPSTVTYTSSSSVKRKVSCPSSYFSLRGTNGRGYYCEQAYGGQYAQPICPPKTSSPPFGLGGTYAWDKAEKKCCRMTKGQKVCLAGKVNCPDRYRYDARSGQCKLPAYFSRPIMVK